MEYEPWKSVVEPAFWGTLGEIKLRQLKLEEGPLALRATYAASNLTLRGTWIPGVLTLSPDSLVDHTHAGQTSLPSLPSPHAVGELFCLNTVERLASFDRQAAVQRAADAVWEAIVSGTAEEDPFLLQRLVLLVYCDLKHYRYHYYFGFPALLPPNPFTLTQPATTLTAHPVLGAKARAVVAACEQRASGATAPPLWLLSFGGPVEGPPSVHALGEWHALRASASDVCLVALDPSNSERRPGWPLRNALLMAAARWGCSTLRLLCLRRRAGRVNPCASMVLQVALPQLPPGFRPQLEGGWEGDGAVPRGARIADLGHAMDPLQLASSAVDLNLQLMKWRAAPLLDLATISALRCLLLGAGTLGCSAARALLGWGVRHVTFVDNSRVSFSNPVRQSLFNFDDCLQGGQPKAAAAAEAVRRVFPGAEATGVELSIPMPGHPPAAAEMEQTRRDAADLASLVDSHDVIFLLLDTREARWLPALLAAAHGKLAITAALGFDGFVVMRHGVGPRRPPPAAAQRPPRLGCYFCNDVVAPANSTVDRTMDQQCTVARPGLSGIAGSLAVELMAATVQHPEGAAAPAAGTPAAAAAAAARSAADTAEPALGDPPHMIRGQLTGFSQVCLSGQAFAQCPACSEVAVSKYVGHGVDFVLQAVSEPGYLEELCGLAELHRASEAALAAEELEGGPGGGSEGEGSDTWEEL